MNEKRYNTLNEYYKNKFNSKVFKVSLDANFSCPNKDGTKGTGGCIFCNPTPFIGDSSKDLVTQFIEVKENIHKKWPNAKYIIYLEANSNTYGSIDKLKSIYEPLLKLDNVVGLNIGTRCDCLNEEILDYLTDLNKRTFLTIELGLQSSKNKTLDFINRRHTQEEFTKTVKKLKERNIQVVVHIINGLPNETTKDMLDTIKYINTLNIDGIKIHMLYIEEGTKLASMYKEKPFYILSEEEYVQIVSNQLSILNKNIVIHRLTSGPDRKKLITPLWLNHKFKVLNDIDKYMEKNNIFQGKKISEN